MPSTSKFLNANAPFAAAILLSIGIAVFLVWSTKAMHAANQDSQEIEETRLELAELRALVFDAQRSQRGYALTGQPEYLTPYGEAERQIPDALRDFLAAYQQSDLDPDLLGAMQENVSMLQRQMNGAIRLRRAGVDLATSEKNEADGKKAMDAFRSATDQLARTLSLKQRECDSHARRASLGATTAIVVGAVVTVSLQLLALAAIRSNKRRPLDSRG